MVELVQKLLERTVVHPPARLQGDRVADQRHICHDEVHDAAAPRHRPKLLAFLVDLERPVLRFGELALDLFGLRLRAGQHLDQFRVVKEVALRVRKPVQELLAQHLKAFRVLGRLLFECRQSLLEDSLLHVQHLDEQLLLQALLRDGEVNHRGARAELGAEMRVGQSGGHVQAEHRVIVDLVVTHLDEHLRPLPYDRLVQHRIEHRVELVLDVLDDQTEPPAHRRVQLLPELPVAQRGDA
mmetsp:Transcript_39922/g.120654  ORF Transcript_39922/g.120654 Transcript_39922/m.120654 type:complete len:240 (+) Transcript_39922:114-833(+)